MGGAMRILTAVLTGSLLLAAAGCRHDDRADQERRAEQARQESETLSRKAGRAAYKASKEAGKLAEKAGHELKKDAHELRQGWKEAQRESKAKDR